MAPCTKVTLTDPFWSTWQQVVSRESLPHQWKMCEETGRLENFRRAARGEQGTHEGLVFNDSDLYKWAEAAAYAVALDKDSPAGPLLEEAVGLVEGAQLADGYVNTFYQLGTKTTHYGAVDGDTLEERRWRQLSSDHEMYCMGHLIEATVAHAEATSSPRFLEVGKKAAGHIASQFGPEKRLGMCGHQEIELALCRLSDHTGSPEWRALGRWMVEKRGRRPSPFEEEVRDMKRLGRSEAYRRFLLAGDVYEGRYLQDDRPLEDHDEPVGHSVRAMYYYCAAHDAYPEGVPDKLQGALKSIWRRLIDRRTYITGGIGSSAENEGFTKDYDLPNLKAYAETCAGIGLIFWARRMALMTGTSEPIDVLERVLYNAVLSGISLDGKAFFYENPLESRGGHLRQPWFGCACCPPNIARLILSLGSYVASESADSVAINLPIGSVIRAAGMELQVASGWPFGGSGEVRVVSAPDEPRTLRIRVPGWAAGAKVLSHRSAWPQGEDGYASCTRTWKAGDTITFDFGLKTRLASSAPEVVDNHGRVAVERGPIVYCMEEADLGAPVSRFRLEEVKGEAGDSDQALLASGSVETGAGSGPWPTYDPSAVKRTEARLIPYFSWANRTPGSMAVWLRHG